MFHVVRVVIVSIIALAYVFGPGGAVATTVSLSWDGLTISTDAWVNEQASADPDDGLPCATDIECVTEHPETIPNAYTIDDYLAVYGDAVKFPTIGDCSRVDWLSQDGDGAWFVPVDLDNDGAINCNSDFELGA